MGGHDHFERKGVSGNKNQYTLFWEKWNFGGFLFDSFFKKKKKKKKNPK